MNGSLIGGRGGTFCQFTIGSGKSGDSAKHLRYIANPQAVRDGQEGVWLKEFPPALTNASYPVLVQRLCQYARWLEQEDIIGHKGRGEVRTHYRAILSFEAPLAIHQAKSMLAQWMQEAFPKTQAAAFVHRNTAHLHIHVWIAARQTDGRKINLSARAFRQLDEQWNRIYSRAVNRDEREHLLKKGQTERFKQLQREGKAQSIERPQRVGDHWNPAVFNDRERKRLEGKLPEKYDRHEGRTGTDKSILAGDASPDAGPERGAPKGEPFADASTRQMRETMHAAQQAVSEIEQLRQDASRVAQRKPEREIEEAERER